MSELERMKLEKDNKERNKSSLFEIKKKTSGTGYAKEFIDSIKPKK